MSDRVTSKWTETTTEAFGNTPEVRKGLVAEQMYYEWASKVYDDVKDHSKDKSNQVKGFDFSIWKKTWKNYYGVDVKGNMYANGSFYVENQSFGWLRNPKKKSDRIVHICPETGWAIEYDRKKMIEHIDSNNLTGEKLLLSSFDKDIKPLVRKFKVG